MKMSAGVLRAKEQAQCTGTFETSAYVCLPLSHWPKQVMGSKPSFTAWRKRLQLFTEGSKMLHCRDTAEETGEDEWAFLQFTTSTIYKFMKQK
jgi:predicted DNA-binding transcriptional regulator AlpA